MRIVLTKIFCFVEFHNSTISCCHLFFKLLEFFSFECVSCISPKYLEALTAKQPPSIHAMLCYSILFFPFITRSRVISSNLFLLFNFLPISPPLFSPHLLLISLLLSTSLFTSLLFHLTFLRLFSLLIPFLSSFLYSFLLFQLVISTCRCRRKYIRSNPLSSDLPALW